MIMSASVFTPDIITLGSFPHNDLENRIVAVKKLSLKWISFICFPMAIFQDLPVPRSVGMT